MFSVDVVQVKGWERPLKSKKLYSTVRLSHTWIKAKIKYKVRHTHSLSLSLCFGGCCYLWSCEYVWILAYVHTRPSPYPLCLLSFLPFYLSIPYSLILPDNHSEGDNTPQQQWINRLARCREQNNVSSAWRERSLSANRFLLYQTFYGRQPKPKSLLGYPTSYISIAVSWVTVV